MSDVLIRDFNKPKSCGSCPFVAFYSRPEDRRCTLRHVEDPELSRLAGQKVNTWVKVTKDKVDKGCPLVEVKPHGRLIDADKLLQEEKELSKEVGMLSGVVPVGHVKNAPTVLEETKWQDGLWRLDKYKEENA